MALALYWARWDQEQVDSVFHQLEELSRFGASKVTRSEFSHSFYATFRKPIPASARTSQYSNFTSRHHSTLLSQHVSLVIVSSHLPSSHSYRVSKWASWGIILSVQATPFVNTYYLGSFARGPFVDHQRFTLWMTWGVASGAVKNKLCLRRLPHLGNER